jgi:hypothetical protein
VSYKVTEVNCSCSKWLLDLPILYISFCGPLKSKNQVYQPLFQAMGRNHPKKFRYQYLLLDKALKPLLLITMVNSDNKRYNSDILI